MICGAVSGWSPHDAGMARARRWMAVAVFLGWTLAGGGAPWSELRAAETDVPPSAEPRPGLAARFESLENPTGEADWTLLTAPRFHVGEGDPATPFIPAGRFRTEIEGSIAADLRSYYRFEAEVRGAMEVIVNGETVLETNQLSGARVISDRVRLNKGENALKIVYSSPESGDSFLRMDWAKRREFAAPIPASAASHLPASELDHASQIREGRRLVAAYRCLKCHRPELPGELAYGLDLDAPAFAGIGGRRGEAWMAKWIANPAAQRPGARMPALFRGEEAKDAGAKIAAFLASLGGSDSQAAEVGNAEAGGRLFEDLKCAVCHQATGESLSQPPDGLRLELGHLNEKFKGGALREFLLAPARHFQWIRMPDFQLTETEAADLSAFLLGASAPASSNPSAGEDGLEEGRRLVQESGCLSCHSLDLPNLFATTPLTDLEASALERGCLGENASAEGTPQFELTAEERRAIAAFLRTDRRSLRRFVAREFAADQVETLNCRQCHGQFDGFPDLEWLGEKLKPDWSEALLAGRVAYRPRPWLAMRMPAFRAGAKGLAAGLAADHGFGTAPSAESPVDPELAEIGRKLISATGGFACVSCHGVRDLPPTQVFEASGINFAHSGERLRRSYYRRWVRNPLRIDPTSKMPVYFEEDGSSPLFTVLEGDGLRQIEAIWHYLRLGPNMPLPVE